MATIKPQTVRGFVQAISGLFISKSNPGGLTPKELDVLAALLFVMEQKSSDSAIITSDVRSDTAAITGHSLQVITNYIKRLRDKRVISEDNVIHPWIIEKHVLIDYTNGNN